MLCMTRMLGIPVCVLLVAFSIFHPKIMEIILPIYGDIFRDDRRPKIKFKKRRNLASHRQCFTPIALS